MIEKEKMEVIEYLQQVIKEEEKIRIYQITLVFFLIMKLNIMLLFKWEKTLTIKNFAHILLSFVVVHHIFKN